MKKEKLYREICLDRLGRQQTQDVIRSVFTESDLPQSFGELIYKETEGNPLFILETLKMLQEEQVICLKDRRWNLTRAVGRISIPDRVNDVITDRLKGLNPEGRSLVDVASVQGDSFQSDPLCYCLGLPRMVVLRGLQTLERRHHLIYSSENEYHFGHGKIRMVIYDSLIPELRREYHRQLGEYLIDSFGEAAEYAGRIVHHLLEAHDEEIVLPYLVKAGEHAKSLFANEEAIQYFDKAAELLSKRLKERPSTTLQRKKLNLLKARAEVRNLIGHYGDAAADYRKIMALSEVLKDRKEEAYGLNGLGITLRRKGDYHWALACFQKALGIQREIGDTRGEGNALNNIGLIHRHLGDYERSLDYHNQALQAARRSRNEYGEGTMLHNIAIIHDSRGDYETGLSCHAQALEIQRRIGDREGEGYTLGSMGLVHTYRGNYEDGLNCLEEALKISKEIGDKRNGGVLFSNIGLLHRYRADYSLAFRYYMQSLEITQEIGNREGQWEVLRHLCKLHLDVGELQKALEMFEEARKMSIELGIGGRRAWFLIDEGMAEFVRGNVKTAHLRSDEGVGIAREMKDVDATIEGLLVAARIEIRRREELKASDTAGEVLRLASEKARIPDVAQAHLLLSHSGLLTLDLGRAESHARDAIRVAQKNGLTELLWQAHHDLGRILLKKRERSLAKMQLEKAEKIVTTIASKLDERLRKSYLSKKEIKQLRRDLRDIRKANGRLKKS
jgi:tetratricopeptide (TPR) repeat protein